MKLRELHESIPDDGVTIHDDVPGKNGHIEMVKKIIKFKDKTEFIKILLLVLKNSGDESTVKEWIARSRKAGYDYPEFKDIEKSLGPIEEGRDFPDSDSVRVYPDSHDPNFSYHDVKYSDKDAFIRLLLSKLKTSFGYPHHIEDMIRKAKKLGYNYPEFRDIEKSIKAHSTEHTWESIGGGGAEDGIPVYTCPDPTKPDVKHVVKFKDHEAFIKLCLQELKTGSVSEVKHWIRMCRGCGYDYPEFKTIEKSIGKVPGKQTEAVFDRQGLEMMANPQGFYTVNNRGHEIFIKYSDKDKIIKYLLERLRDNKHFPEFPLEVSYRIQRCREAGYDYPEFKAIEKSMGKRE